MNSYANEKRELLLTVITPPLIFFSGFYRFIQYHDYGLLEPEVILCFAAIGLMGSLIGLLLASAGATNLRAMGFALLLFIFFDIEFELIEKINNFITIQSNILLRYGTLIVLLFVAQLAIMGLRKHLATILATIFATMLITTATFPGTKVHFGPQPVYANAATTLDAPPVIHLILDGHIGIEGIPRDIQGGEEVRDLLIDFYERWGFRLYGRAYSKYILTYDSVSNLLNGVLSKTGGQMTTVTSQHGKPGWKPVDNKLFKQFSDSGYMIRVYQTDYLDYCQDSIKAIEYCYRYSSSSPIMLKPLDMSATEKAELILGSYFAENSYFRISHKLYGYISSVLPPGIPFKWTRKNYQFSSLGAPAAISQLKSDIIKEHRGRLFFAHLLLPHGPYIWDSNCQIRKDSDTWLSRRTNHEDMLSLSNESYRNTAYKYYFQQIECTVSLLDDLLQTLDNRKILEDATIIIHGDHGSRITIADPVMPMMDHLENRDYIDSFSTLFAIRSSTIAPGYDDNQIAVQSLFSELVLKGNKIIDDSSVYLLTGPLIQKRPLEVVPIPLF